MSTMCEPPPQVSPPPDDPTRYAYPVSSLIATLCTDPMSVYMAVASNSRASVTSRSWVRSKTCMPCAPAPSATMKAWSLKTLMSRHVLAGLPSVLEPLARIRQLGSGVGVADEDAKRLLAAAPHATAQLVQLRQAKALGVFDDHHRGIGHIHPNLDDRGADQDLDPVLLKILHDRGLFFGCHAPVQQGHGELGQRAVAQLVVGFDRRFIIHLFRFFDQRIYHVHLPPLAHLIAGKLKDCLAAVAAAQSRADRLAPRGQLVDDRYIQFAVQSQS